MAVWYSGAALTWMVVTVMMVHAQGNICNSIVPLTNNCNSDQGSPEPGNLQAVYLRHPDYPHNWWYPQSDRNDISYYSHPTRTITETSYSWAKWIWHDCGDGYVCLESGKYPNYYFFVGYTAGIYLKRCHGYVKYTLTPESDAKLKIIRNERTSSSPLMEFASTYEGQGYKNFGIKAYVYIPHRCEGYKQVAEHFNPGPGLKSFKYTYETGITKTDSISTTVTRGISSEIITAIISASMSGSFSQSWTHEKSTSVSEKDAHEIAYTVPVGKRMVVWQKMATYGLYVWRSGTFIPCLKDI